MQLVNSIEQVKENAKRFSQVFDHPESDAYERLPLFSHWYYFSETGVFAPSKFIGYQDTSISSYTGSGSGSDTEKELKKWFIKLDKSSSTYKTLEKKLIAFLEKANKKINKKIIDGSGEIHILKNQAMANLFSDLQDIEESDEPETTKKQLRDARIGQGKFRREVLQQWKQSCAVTGCSISSLLRASHIKPWAVSSKSECLNPENGLPLIGTLDLLFDQGFISFDTDGKLQVSPNLPESELVNLGPLGNLRHKPSEQQAAFLIYHGKEVFKKG